MLQFWGNLRKINFWELAGIQKFCSSNSRPKVLVIKQNVVVLTISGDIIDAKGDHD